MLISQSLICFGLLSAKEALNVYVFESKASGSLEGLAVKVHYAYIAGYDTTNP